MKKELAQSYRCPATGEALKLEVSKEQGGEVIEGAFVAACGNRYPIRNGLPDFTYPFTLEASDEEARQYYNEKADEYDAFLPLTFDTFKEDETAVRNRMIDDLNLKPDSMVLEVGAGSGRDSELILKRLDRDGQLFLQDISPGIFSKAVEKLKHATPAPAFFLSNGSYLPFADNSFDATYHFGGLNTFANIKRAIAEAVRVTKVGGKVVIGDESMPVWLRDTEFGKVLMNSNPHYRYGLPLECMPVEARKTRLRWIVGEVFYVIDFEVGEGTPAADLDFEIPGPRGGTHRTRYYGHMEGVTPEVKRAAQEAARHSGKSLHQWLCDTINAAAAQNRKSGT
ncbi:MAG: methyltransferase domain-containing protein [Alphaproteobacteria bacterium]